MSEASLGQRAWPPSRAPDPGTAGGCGSSRVPSCTGAQQGRSGGRSSSARDLSDRLLAFPPRSLTGELEAGLEEEEEEGNCCFCFPALTTTERLLAWLTCFLGGMGISALSLGKPSKQLRRTVLLIDMSEVCRKVLGKHVSDRPALCCGRVQPESSACPAWQEVVSVLRGRKRTVASCVCKSAFLCSYQPLRVGRLKVFVKILICSR